MAAAWSLVRDGVPDGATIFDVHTHIGTDIDGMTGTPAELLAFQDTAGISQAFTFCLDEPDRAPAFRAANDRTLADVRSSGGRLIPFVRLDLSDSPVEEAERCLDLGARGIKLHPRAQRFSVGDDRLAPIFELAADRHVPILIHGGRGLPPIAAELAALVERYAGVQLVIAHAGIADLAGLAGRLGGIPGVYFDTSVWSPVDLLELFRRVSPEQVVFATDYPYGRIPSALLIALRTAKVAGLDENAVCGMLGGNALRIGASDGGGTLGPPCGEDTFRQPLAFARIHQYLSMALPALWLGQSETIGVLRLAVNASLDAHDGHEDAALIREALIAASDLWDALGEIDDERERATIRRTVGSLAHIADILAVTAATA